MTHTNLSNLHQNEISYDNTQIDEKSTTVNNLVSQSHELLSAFTEDEVFAVNRVQTRRMKRKEHSLQDANEVINENSSLEDVKDFNVNSKSNITQRLSQYNLKDRFVNYILLKFPFLDIERLIKLQQTDPYFQTIIEMCNSSSNKTCDKQGKHGFSFTIRQGILLRIYTCQEGIVRLQICCPKITLPDTLLTCLLYTSPSPRDRTRSRMPSSA